MTQCWSEGELRAFLDGELPSRDMDRAAAHMKECAACGSLCEELSARAGQVAELLQSLPESRAPYRMPLAPERIRSGKRWAISAAGLAAALALGIALTPKRVEKVENAVVTPRLPAPPPAVAVPAPPPAAVKPAIIRRVPRKGAPAAKPKPQIQYYVALDNEPIDTGLVVRVGLNGGQIPADVIVGPDGRARAIRLISDISGEPK